MNYQIFQAMARIASIAVLAMASDFMEDDEDEVEADRLQLMIAIFHLLWNCLSDVPFHLQMFFEDEENDCDEDEGEFDHLVKNATHVSNLQAELAYSAIWTLEVEI